MGRWIVVEMDGWDLGRKQDSNCNWIWKLDAEGCGEPSRSSLFWREIVLQVQRGCSFSMPFPLQRLGSVLISSHIPWWVCFDGKVQNHLVVDAGLCTHIIPLMVFFCVFSSLHSLRGASSTQFQFLNCQQIHLQDSCFLQFPGQKDWHLLLMTLFLSFLLPIM